MEQLKTIKDSLIGVIQGQMGHLEQVDAKELGEVIDMVKDIEEAIYYCTITKAMNGEPGYEQWSWKDREEEYEPRYYPRMYYSEPMKAEPDNMKNGRSPHTRRMYMESKEMHHDKTVQIQNLEQYMKELSTDVVEMIQGSSPEEKQLLKSKLTTLISKIDHA